MPSVRRKGREGRKFEVEGGGDKSQEEWNKGDSSQVSEKERMGGLGQVERGRKLK